MVLGILLIILTWAFYLIAVCGLGLSLQRLILSGKAYPETLLSSFWIGLSVLIIFLQIWHLFAPVNMIAFLFVMIVSLISIIFSRSYILSILTKINNNIIIFFLYFSMLSLLIAYQAMGLVIVHDSGLYHIPSVKWISSYPIVPGLGNLHGRLAFNSSFFLFASLIKAGFWYNKFHHVVGGLFFLVIFLEAGLILWKVLFSRKPVQPPDVMMVLLIPPLVILCKLFASSPTPDVPVFILGAVVALQFGRMIYQISDNHLTFYRIFLIITLSAIGITIKITFIVLGVIFSIIAFTKLFEITAPNERKKQKYFLLILVTLLLIVFPWMVRSVILSGYIAYPFPYLSFPMDWRIPFENALNEYLWIKSWARMPYIPPAQVLSNWHWLGPWIIGLFNNRYLLLMIVFPMGLACLGLILMFRKLKEIPMALYSFALFMAPPALSLFFWFWSAPDQRFAGVSFWYVGAGTLAVSSQYLKFPPRQVQFSFAIFTALVLLLSVIFYRGSLHKTHTLVPSAYGFYPLPIVELHENYTNSGLRVFTPKKGDQCWDGPIPCTPLVQANLCLRKRNDIVSGFKISLEEKIKTQQE